MATRYVLLLLITLSAVFVQSCKNDSDETFATTGTIVFLSFEGGFYGIKGDDGRNYDPTNLADEFRKEGLRVRLRAKELKDQASFHMWGRLIEIVEIQKL